MATGAAHGWTFLSNHGHVLVALSRDPDARVREIAEVVGITERAAHAILRDLEDAGYVTKEKVGRRNAYGLHTDLRLRHPAEADTAVRDLLAIFK
ncbi:helix-turn-helix transcriptional regulator [Nocardioides sp.]|uniref:helix-turn-helix transcriptional regulator n=1 Tax=Nocardioides sp. TaxID=35761 RepID=UPI003784729C